MHKCYHLIGFIKVRLDFNYIIIQLLRIFKISFVVLCQSQPIQRLDVSGILLQYFGIPLLLSFVVGIEQIAHCQLVVGRELWECEPFAFAEPDFLLFRAQPNESVIIVWKSLYDAFQHQVIHISVLSKESCFLLGHCKLFKFIIWTCFTR
jgi:hypothetical protein